MWYNKYFKNFSFYLFKFAFESFFEILRFKKVIDSSYENIQRSFNPSSRVVSGSIYLVVIGPITIEFSVPQAS